MKFSLVALTALAAVAAAAPSVERDGLEIRAEEPKQVKKLTFYTWDGKAQDIGDATVFYNDPDVVADVPKDAGAGGAAGLATSVTPAATATGVAAVLAAAAPPGDGSRLFVIAQK
ncbi:hypothetical protein A1Q2_06559 [Trichosporon asahii var. asahii CBS 8904]|uniref:Uncharacterized protein n=1 Tax=Trichosporon asahii var. asahii (strain CBS 8904) TaxID=1220162 RepID=K1VE89_TRIAC|nr:hypothetical protein A1Q2_06559 [Trichosporon asahii var. asahii CBS 8904]